MDFRKLFKPWWDNYLVLKIFFCIFSTEVSADILVRDAGVSEATLRTFLIENSNYTPFEDYFISTKESLEYSTSQLLSDAESETDLKKQKILIQSIYNQLRNTFLSNQKRVLWAETLALEKKNIPNFDAQIKGIFTKDDLFNHQNDSNYFKLTDLDFDTEDNIFINGWKIVSEEQNKIFLNKSLVYHFLFLSNSKLPLIILDKPHKLDIQRLTLVRGSCQKPVFDSSLTELKSVKLKALFSDNCLAMKLNNYPEDSESQIDFVKSLESDKTFKSNWRQSPYTYGTILIGMLLFSNYSDLKNYRIKITLAF